jgi:tripartite-type tricarboxylate transporter receptor subunit TctC
MRGMCPAAARALEKTVKYGDLAIAFAAICSLSTCGLAATQAGSAAQYPEKPIRLIVPYPAGGGADRWARLISRQLSGKLGQPVTVENAPGHGGNDGTVIASRAAPDGYTLLLGSVGPQAVHQFTYSKLAFDPEHDFTPIALLESSPIVLVASTDVPASSARELIDMARARPGTLSYASNGNGSPEEVAGELFKKRLQLDIRHVPYDGAGPARKAVIAAQVALMFDPSKAALPAIRKGLQRPLAVAAAKRLPALPDVPTFGEIGVENYDLRIWTGVLAPGGTPKGVIARLNAVIQEILESPEIKQEIANEGGQAGSTTPEAFAAFLRADREHWRELVNESGVPKVL